MDDTHPDPNDIAGGDTIAASTDFDGPLLVGTDWSEQSQHALEWAANVGHRLDRDLILLHANSPWVGMEVSIPVFDSQAYRETVQLAVDEWSSRIDGVKLSSEIVEDDPAHALVIAAGERHAGLIVLGAHAGAKWGPRLLGSVTSKVLHSTAIPTAVVPPTAAPALPHRVVVGVDGSASSLRALRWVSVWAADLDVPVHVVCAFPGEAYAEKPRLADPDSVDPVEDTLGSLRTLALQVSRESGVSVSSDVEIGHAAERLIDAAGDDSVLAVGRTGHSTFSEVVFGSTSRSCATHARVPVVVVS